MVYQLKAAPACTGSTAPLTAAVNGPTESVMRIVSTVIPARCPSDWPPQVLRPCFFTVGGRRRYSVP